METKLEHFIAKIKRLTRDKESAKNLNGERKVS